MADDLPPNLSDTLADVRRRLDAQRAKANGDMPDDEYFDGHGDDVAGPSEPAPAEPARVELVSFSAVDIAKPLPPQAYICKRLGMVAGGGAPHMIAGYGFSGKTLALQVMLICLAAGKLVWGAFDGPGRPLRVGHVDAEQGEALTFLRYQRAARGHGIDLAQLGDALRCWVMPKKGDKRRLLLTPEDKPYWLDIMASRDLLAVDSLAALSGNIEENSRDQRACLDLLGECSEETKCRALVLHHATKPPSQSMGQGRETRYSIRGSGAIYDALDSAYVFSGEIGEDVKVEHVKARSHGEPCEEFALSFADIEQGGDARWGLTCTVFGVERIAEQRDKKQRAVAEATDAKNARKIREALARGPLSKTDLMAAAKLNGVELARAILKLGEDVRVEAVKQGRTWTKMHKLGGVS